MYISRLKDEFDNYSTFTICSSFCNSNSKVEEHIYLPVILMVQVGIYSLIPQLSFTCSMVDLGWGPGNEARGSEQLDK